MSSLGILAGLALISATQNPATAEDSFAMMAHWRCQVWSAMAGNNETAETHHERGLAAGRRFIEAARAGLIPPADFDSTVPVYVSLSMQGPSDDFVLGRLYEITTTDAYDQIATRDKEGRPLSPADYVTDKSLQSVMASERFLSSNCASLRR